MTRELDFEQLLDIWLDDGPTDTADAVFDAAVSRVYRQRQRPAWRLLWRSPHMNGTLRLAVAAVAVVLAAGAAALVLRQPTSNVGGPATPIPSPTPEATPGVSPLSYVWPGALEPGTYTTSLVWDVPFQFEFTVPDGWEGYDIEVSPASQQSLSVEFVLVENVFEDPCLETSKAPPVGPSVDELVAALSGLPGLDTSQPSPIDFDRSIRGVELDYTLGSDAACAATAFVLWDLPEAKFEPGAPSGGDRKDLRAEQGRLRILDVGGQRVVLRATWDEGATPAERTEVEGVFESIGIVRPGATPPPAPASP